MGLSAFNRARRQRAQALEQERLERERQEAKQKAEKKPTGTHSVKKQDQGEKSQ